MSEAATADTPAWAAFLTELRARGLDAPDPVRVLGQLAVHLALFFGGLAAFGLATGWGWRLAGLALALAGTVGVALNTHSSAHGATTRSPHLDRALALLGFPLVCTFSLTGWNLKHLRHHAHPNVAGLDPDHDFMPYFAFSTAQLAPERGTGYYRWQWIFFPLAVAVMSVRMRWVGYGLLGGELRKPASPARTRAALDALCVAASEVLWWALPLALLPLPDVLLLHGARAVVLSFVLFAAFAPAHIPAAAPYLTAVDRDADPMLHQLATTLNYRCSRLTSFFLGGLDHQLEHHLAPHVPHTRYREIAPVLEAFCRERGWPYRTLGWGEAIAATCKVVVRPKPGTSDLAAWLAEAPRP